MPSQSERQAVVIGGSIAGLLAARVLSESFDRVTVLERDRLSDAATPRRGVPQSVQPHVLFAKGYRILEELFPGIGRSLAAAGAVAFDWGMDFRHFQAGRWSATLSQPTGLHSYTCTRPLLESMIRQRVQSLPNVQLLTNQRVVGLCGDRSRNQITGVKLDQRRHPAMDTLPAHLVVDASGRGSQAPHWLQTLGFTPPVATVIDPGLGYATRRYRLPETVELNCKILLISHEPPQQRRLGYLAQVENGEWIATLGGYGHDFPPASDEGFQAFACSLPSPEFYNAIASAEPRSEIQVHRATANRCFHYEKTLLPDGFIAIGDAVCALCPVYGQGMTVSARAALVLQQWLSQPQPRDRALNGRKFQQQLARSNAFPWSLATGLDSQFPSTQGGITPSWGARLFRQYTQRLIERTQVDPELQLQFLEMAHMLRSPAVLVHPRVILKALT
jgi:2-polyprenyl-6-methoxyphenol hydroxylase-like FAD-dependent oxidoreductase